MFKILCQLNESWYAQPKQNEMKTDMNKENIDFDFQKTLKAVSKYIINNYFSCSNLCPKLCLNCARQGQIFPNKTKQNQKFKKKFHNFKVLKL